MTSTVAGRSILIVEDEPKLGDFPQEPIITDDRPAGAGRRTSIDVRRCRYRVSGRDSQLFEPTVVYADLRLEGLHAGGRDYKAPWGLTPA